MATQVHKGTLLPYGRRICGCLSSPHLLLQTDDLTLCLLPFPRLPNPSPRSRL